MARDDGTSRGVRRIVVPLALLAFVVAGAFVATRSTPDESAPSAPTSKPDAPAPPQRTPRVHPIDTSAPPPAKSVRVAVTSLDGKPIVGARVELFRGPASDVCLGGRELADVAPKPERTIDADDADPATFDDVASGRWFVVASAPGYARHVLLGVTREDDAGVDAPVMLERGSAFAGTVFDPDGAPAAGVVVALCPNSLWPNEVEVLRTTTGKNGAYRFDAVEAGEYSLDYSARPDVFVAAARVLLPSLDGLDVRMVRGATIAGVVRDDATGDAVPGARVFAFRYVESNISGLPGATTRIDVAVADHLGRYALQTWRRQFEVTYLVVDAPGYAPTPSAKSDKLPPGAVADGQKFVCDLRVRRAATLSGTLSGPDGPLAGFRVRAWPKGAHEQSLPTAFPWSCATGPDGSFRIDRIPAGTVEASVRDFGIDVVPAQDVDLAGGEEKKLDLRVEVKRVRVTRRVVEVVDMNENPVAGVDVVQQFGPTRTVARTDADGRFTIDAVFAGYSAPVELRRGPFRSRALMGRDDEDGHELFPPLPSATVVAGVLSHQDGTPVAGMRVGLSGGFAGMHGDFFPEWAGLRESASGGDGAFRMALTSGPDQTIAVWPWGWFSRAPDEDGVFRVKAPDVVRVVGRAVAADGDAPIAGTWIVDKEDVVVARAGGDARFEFGWSPQFEGAVHLECDGWTPADIDGGAGEKIVAMRRSPVVTGVVRNPDGSPARGLRVVVRHVGDMNPEPDWKTTSATDVDGRFVVPGVAAGDVEVVVFDPTRHAVAGSRATTTAGGGDVALVVRPASPLLVEVVNDKGQAAFRADVTARAESADLAGDVAEADGDGRVTLGLAPDATYTIRVERWGIETFEQKGVRVGAEPLKIIVKSRN
jgi:5-hydroxyisourate hydrolase-like protein (transthyretin family)